MSAFGGKADIAQSSENVPLLTDAVEKGLVIIALA
jgi:hypothetical protein